MFGADFLLFRTNYLPLAAFKFQRECYILRNAHALREVICLGHTFPLGKVCGFLWYFTSTSELITSVSSSSSNWGRDLK